MLKASYSAETNILRLKTTEWGREETCAHLEDDLDVLLSLDDEAGTHVVGLDVMAGSAYLPLGKRGYDAEADTLTLGVVPDAPEHTAENADIVTYWQPDRHEGRSLTPVGVTLRRAAWHLAEVARNLA